MEDGEAKYPDLQWVVDELYKDINATMPARPAEHGSESGCTQSSASASQSMDDEDDAASGSDAGGGDKGGDDAASAADAKSDGKEEEDSDAKLLLRIKSLKERKQDFQQARAN